MIGNICGLLVIMFFSTVTNASDMAMWCYKKAHEIALDVSVEKKIDKIQEWKKFENRCSKSGMYQQMLADFYISYGMFDEAQEYLEGQIDRDDIDTRKLELFLVGTYRHFGLVEKMNNLTKNMLEKYPSWHGAHYARGLYMAYIENWATAHKLLLDSIEASPKHLPSFLNMAIVAYKLDNFHGSVRHYFKAIAINKKLAVLHKEATMFSLRACIKSNQLDKAARIISIMEEYEI